MYCIEAGGVTQWQSISLASMMPWVQFMVPQNLNKHRKRQKREGENRKKTYNLLLLLLLHMVAYTYSLSIVEVKAGGSGVRHQPGLHIKTMF